MCVQNVKFVGGTLKLWAVPGYAHAHFSPKFLMNFCLDGPCECTGQIFEVRSFTRSRDNSDWSFGWWLRTPILGEVGRRGSGMVAFERALVSSCMGPP